MPADPRSQSDGERVTRLVESAAGGDRRAAEELLPLVYEELRKLAAARMARERGGGAGATLEPTALVHEAYMRLLGPAGSAGAHWDHRGHFFAAAAEAMRRILVERARSRGRLKRGGGRGRVELDAAAQAAAIQDDGADVGDEMLEIDSLLGELEHDSPRRAEIVKLRVFVGMSVPEVAEALGVGARTVDREWAEGKKWLKERIGGGSARG